MAPPSSENKRNGPARWTRGYNNVSHIFPRRSMAGRLEPAGDGDTGGYQFSILVIDPQPLTRNCLVAAMEGASNLTMITAADGVNEARQLVDEGAIFDAAVLNLDQRSEEHTSELQSLMRNSYAVCGVEKKNT